MGRNAGTAARGFADAKPIIVLIVVLGVIFGGTLAFSKSSPDSSETTSESSVAAPVDLPRSALLIVGSALVGVAVIARKGTR